MKFAIITHVEHKKHSNKWFCYEPYVREMNLWNKYASEVKIVAPISIKSPIKIDSFYNKENIEVIKIPKVNLLTVFNLFIALINAPIICYRIIKVFMWADHIHLRCPGNVGLLGAILQVFFPSKNKTAKYAGNWDPTSKQPRSYRFQKWILSNTLLSKNMKVLVYGKWKNQSSNIIPFFTASYSEKEIIELKQKVTFDKINFIYVGAFTKGKQPLLSVKIIASLFKKGYNVHLNMFGDGEEYSIVEEYINKNKLKSIITLHGNVDKEKIKQSFQNSHFLLFISKSEGWPKVVAESMFWSCLPISSEVSCVPYMLGNGLRGGLINKENEIIPLVESYINDKIKYKNHVKNACTWSQKLTLEKFELELKSIIN